MPVVLVLKEILQRFTTLPLLAAEEEQVAVALMEELVDLEEEELTVLMEELVILHQFLHLREIPVVMDPQMITEPDLTRLMPVVVAVPAGVVAVLEEEDQVVVDLVGHIITSQPMDFLMVLEFMEPQTLVEEVVVVPVQTPLRVATVDLVSLLFVIKPLPKYLKT